MTKVIHTPGPWEIENDGGWRAILSYQRRIAKLYDHKNAEADARLIAAAPDLLAALEECADLLWQYGGDQSSDDGWKTEEIREACLNARTAIAKAKQRSITLRKSALTAKREQVMTVTVGRLHIQLLFSKWVLTLERHRSELDKVEREMTEYVAQLNQLGLSIEQESVE